MSIMIQVNKTSSSWVIWNLVEAAGIEPASVSPTLTGDYMLSLSLCV